MAALWVAYGDFPGPGFRYPGRPPEAMLQGAGHRPPRLKAGSSRVPEQIFAISAAVRSGKLPLAAENKDETRQDGAQVAPKAPQPPLLSLRSR